MGAKIYPVLDLTGRGHDVMIGNEQILLSHPPEADERPVSPEGPVAPKLQMEIFNRLRVLRSSLAQKEGLPAYCIFQDRTLREMSRVLPKTRDDLLGIVGVGEVTLRKYGRQFLELIEKIGNEL